MVEDKRFTSDIHRICDNDEEIACADTMGDAEILVDRLNKQDERIKELEIELASMTQRFEYELQMKLKYHSKLIECKKKGDVE